MSLERIEDEELEVPGLYVRISCDPDEMQSDEVREKARRIIEAFRYETPKKPGHGIQEAMAKLACPRCKGKGEYFDHEDEEMTPCVDCHGSGLKTEKTKDHSICTMVNGRCTICGDTE